MPVRVREAVVADAASIAAVHVAGWQVGYRGIVAAAFLASLNVDRRAKAFENMLRQGQGDMLVVLNENDAVVGFAMLQASRDDDAGEHVGEISAMYVHPDHWGKGYGRALMQACLQRARAHGFTQVSLWVLYGNERGRRFYAQAGFRRDGVEKTETRGEHGVFYQVRYARRVPGDMEAADDALPIY